ncbi:hypothetical protein V865_005699 [Kwoniella europaea PYCC6329]|uniref:Uncharacterized protein n=1 Tax=Kwoniella europaea PYCC6329 TaxID=1423913 RepID=A0AAX4KQH2_9TREE
MSSNQSPDQNQQEQQPPANMQSRWSSSTDTSAGRVSHLGAYSEGAPTPSRRYSDLSSAAPEYTSRQASARTSQHSAAGSAPPGYTSQAASARSSQYPPTTTTAIATSSTTSTAGGATTTATAGPTTYIPRGHPQRVATGGTYIPMGHPDYQGGSGSGSGSGSGGSRGQ